MPHRIYVYENVPFFAKVQLSGNRAPLKIRIDYETEAGDLCIYGSTVDREPSEKASEYVYKKNPKQIKLTDFTGASALYLALISETGVKITVHVQFGTLTLN